MLGERLARNRVGEEEGFAWRGVEISRIEGLSDATSWAGLAYLLLFPLQAVNGYLMRSRRISNAIANGAGTAREETGDR